MLIIGDVGCLERLEKPQNLKIDIYLEEYLIPIVEQTFMGKKVLPVKTFISVYKIGDMVKSKKEEINKP